MKHLAGIPNVTIARFGGPGMNDKGMAYLSSLKSLKRLDLTDCSSIGDETLKMVGGIPTIEVLTLRRAGFTDAGLESIKTLSKLRAIDLRNTNITDAGVAHLAGIKTLVDVQLENSKVSDAGVEHLRGLPLKSLNLNYTVVTDAAMPAIGSHHDAGISADGYVTHHGCRHGGSRETEETQTLWLPTGQYQR